MKISGFTFTKNATKLYYPIKASIESLLPLVDEFVVALGDCDADDHSEQEILSIQSTKIKIIRTVWDLKKYPNGMEYAHQTDIAKNACSGDWLFYLQSDEVVHEKYLPLIKRNCEIFLNDREVDGFLFNYTHFWGDYDHYILSHAFYNKDIRIIRNQPDIHSWRDAQSFRIIPDFDNLNYSQKENTQKLKVVSLDAAIYHYGFVRPPLLMQRKTKNHHSNYKGEKSTIEKFKNKKEEFDYGDLSKLSVFKETHPETMKAFINKFNWKNLLRFTANAGNKPLHKHERKKYRYLTFVEENILGGMRMFVFRNYKKLNKKSLNLFF